MLVTEREEQTKSRMHLSPRMRCATHASPDQTHLSRARGINRDHSTESDSTLYGLDSLINAPPKYG